jgi:hypothetical protein
MIGITCLRFALPQPRVAQPHRWALNADGTWSTFARAKRSRLDGAGFRLPPELDAKYHRGSTWTQIWMCYLASN